MLAGEVHGLLPSPASATTSIPGSVESISAMPWRTRAWSSARSTYRAAGYGAGVYRIFSRIRGRLTSALAPPLGSGTSPKEPSSNETRLHRAQAQPFGGTVLGVETRPVVADAGRDVLRVIPTSTSIRSEPEAAALRTPSLKTM